GLHKKPRKNKSTLPVTTATRGRLATLQAVGEFYGKIRSFFDLTCLLGVLIVRTARAFEGFE
ncbi:MAG: hypothetical protein WCF52_18100, partial [Pseudolabrys sp.]